MTNLPTAKQAAKLSKAYAYEEQQQLLKIADDIVRHAQKGLRHFVFQGNLLQPTVAELRKQGYIVSNGDDSAYEDFWYIKW